MAETDGGGPRQPRRWALRNWRVRSRLIALIAVPTLVAVALGAVGVGLSLSGAATYGRVGALADVAAAVTTTVGDLEDEQAQSAAFVGAGRPTDRGRTLADAQRRTDAGTARLREVAAGIGDDYPDTTRDRLRRVLFRLDTLPALRSAVTAGRFPAGVTVDRYDTVVTDLLALDDEIAQEGTDPELSASVRALGALSRSRAALAEQRALLGAAFLAGRFEPGGDETLVRAVAAQDSALQQFRASAPQARRYDEVVAGADVDQTSAIRDGVVAGRPPAGGAAAAGSWEASAAGTLTRVGTVESELVTAVADRASSLRSDALRQALIVGILALAVVLIVFVATTAVARSLVRPLRALRDGALAVAERRLPETVARLGTEDPDTVDTRVEPIAVHTSDEIGEVARSFDAVHSEAVRAAVAEARRRAQAGALFVTLSRRTQSLVDRQIELIDELERGEQDGDRLDSLFRLDHLATRMRRNGENLLVLGGQEPVRRWDRPLRLLDVLRAALSEIEQYPRIDLDPVPDVTVERGAVSDVVHLLAELLDNATAFSSRTSRVQVTTTRLPDGSALVEITDRGIGLTAQECDELGERLASPGEVDVDASRRMGLYVVGRLAARLGARVWLRPGERRGVIASAALPSALLQDGEPDADPAPTAPPADGGAWIGERWSRAVATPGPGAASWFGGAPLGAVDPSEPAATDGPPVNDPVPAGGPATGGAAGATAAGAAAAGAAAFVPRASGTTGSGLPQREPGANEVPGAWPEPDADLSRQPTRPGGRHAAPDSPAPAGPATDGADGSSADRSPEAVRRRYAAYQRGRTRLRDGEPAASTAQTGNGGPGADEWEAPPPPRPGDAATGSGPAVAGAVAGGAVVGATADGSDGTAPADAPSTVPSADAGPAGATVTEPAPQPGPATTPAPTGPQDGDPAPSNPPPAAPIGGASTANGTGPGDHWVAGPVREPTADGETSSGLPQRAPGANYVPGAVPDEHDGESGGGNGGPARPAWDRSADAIRARYAAHQQGRRQGRQQGEKQGTERTGR